MSRDSYTRYPRPILWLVRGGQLDAGAGGGPRVEVEPFYVGKFPVTNEQLEAFEAGFERSPLSPGDRDPAAGVSFELAQSYCAWYAGVARKPMRLPTEVEWEHACRGGEEGACPGTSGDDLWHRGNAPERMPRLDAKKANGFGLYGMLGGVWEWTVSSEGAGVLRGGSIRLHRDEITCSLRRERSERLDDVGFRIVKSFRR